MIVPSILVNEHGHCGKFDLQRQFACSTEHFPCYTRSVQGTRLPLVPGTCACPCSRRGHNRVLGQFDLALGTNTTYIVRRTKGGIMASTNTSHSERINLRLSETAKRRIEQAASVEGKTVSAFVVSSALETAEKTIERHETIALARNNAMRFFDALADPPPPNDRLSAALEEHAQRVVSR